MFDDPNAKRTLPEGYDSLYLHSAVDADGDGKITLDEFEIAATHAGRNASGYHHDYVLFEPGQVIFLNNN